MAQQLSLRKVIARRTIPANSHAEKARAAALPLSFPHRIEDAGADAFQIAVGAFTLNLHRQAVLRTHVFATTALQNEPDVDVTVPRGFPMKHRTARAEVISGVMAGDAVDRILSQIAFLSGFFHGFLCPLLELELIHILRDFEIKRNRSGVLADGKGLRLGKANV